MKAWKLHTACVIVAALPSGAWAQSQTTATNQTPPSSETTPSPPATATTVAGAEAGSGVQDIVVTAQRRSERLQNVPVAVTAVSAARLESAGIQNTLDLTLVTPGLTSPQVAGFAQPHIRGVGSSSNGPGIEAPVATYIDGVYLAAAPAALLSLNNVERIEVLKGPQGTLFGRNATGGLIQLVTKDPQQTPHGALNLSYGNYEDAAADLYLTGGLTDDLAGDVALRYEHQGDGYGKNLFTGNDTGKLNHDFAVRTKLLFKPSAETQVRLALDYEDRASSRDVQHLGRQYPGTFNNAFFGGPYPLGSPYDINEERDYIWKLKSGGASLQVNQDIGNVALQSITAYRQSNFNLPLDVDLTPANLIRILANEKDNQFSQEFQLSGKSPGRLKWVGGVFFFRSNARWAPIDLSFGPSVVSPVPGVPADVVINDLQRTTAVAGYAQGTYEILPATNITAGLRYSYEHKSISGEEDFVVAGNVASRTPIPTPGLGIPTSVSYRKLTYRVALDHKFGNDVLGYVSYNTGFKSGGYNLGVAFNPPYKPETIGSLEAGLKSELFDRHLRVNVAAFRYNYDNIQVGRYQDSQETIYNGARARLYGVDLDAEVVILRGLSLTGGFAYIHDRFTSFPDADFTVPVNGCVPPPGGVCSGSAAGKELPFTPTTTFNVGGTYKTTVGFGTLTLAADYFRTARFFAAPDNNLRQDAYDILNASLTWTSSNDHFSVKVFGKNLGNTVYATSLIVGSQGPTISTGAPRTYGVTAGYKF